VKHMTHEHQKALIEHCSKYKDCAMPIFALSPTKDGISSTIINHSANTITPLPILGNLEQQQEQHILGRQCIDVALSSDTSMISNKKPSTELKPSKAQLEIHRKWQAAAEAEGGSNARIVLYKPTAKKMIFEFLFDAFRPMNITEIYKVLFHSTSSLRGLRLVLICLTFYTFLQGLKAIVPSPILKACLDDMALDNDYSTQFVDSDNDDDDKTTKDKKIHNSASIYTQFKNSLSYKGGKGSSSGLYYVNYNEAKGGDGLDGEEKNQLSADIATAISKKSVIEHELYNKRAVATKLRSEPVNDDLNTLLAKAESESCELFSQLECTRKFKANEKLKEYTKKRIDYFSSVWRKRRKLCMDFLICMEELTEGLVTLKTCLGGNGQIDIESDENIISLAREFSKKKRHHNVSLQTAEPNMNSGTSKPGLQPSKNFVAVSLDSQCKVQRIYIGDSFGIP
jgi:hypothetical protein